MSLHKILSRNNLYIKNWFKYHRVLLLAVPTGIIAGLGSVLFFTLLDLSHAFFLEFMAGYRPESPGGEHSLFHVPFHPFLRWMLLVVPTLGGLLSGWLVYSLAPEAEGHGTDAALDAYHFKNAEIRARVPFIKTIASALTIGSGGSGGREGPIAQIGAGFGSIIAKWMGLNKTERRTLMMAGMSAGIGSIFHAPLAGAIFAAEILYRDIDMEYELLVPSAITSVVAYCTFSMFFGFGTLFLTPEFQFESAKEIIPYTLLGVIAAFAANIHARFFYAVRDFFERIPVLPHFKPAIGGLLTGLVGFILPASIYTGYGVLQQAINGRLTMQFMLAVAGAKILTTAFSIASGGSGGVFGPSVVIGGVLGGALGCALQHVMPGFVPNPNAYVIVGMAGFFAAAASTPFSTVIMVSEMTGGYGLLLPAIWVCTISFLFRGKKGLYEKQILTRFDTPIHRGDFLVGSLAHMTVYEVLKRLKAMQVDLIPPGASLPQLLRYMARSRYSTFAVVNENGSYIGVVTAMKVREIVSTKGIPSDIKASDIMEPRGTVYLWESLSDAVKKMAAEGVDEMAVLSTRDVSRNFAGMLARSDVLKAYEQSIEDGESSK